MSRLPLPLMVATIMAPQVLETLYSPALTAIRTDYNVSAAQASQTLSIYFFAFACGVAIWGIMCDRFGRRVTMLAGLTIYLIGAVMALLSQNFTLLLVARAVVAFGAAVGSIVTQTMLRDVYQGQSLGKVFSTLGIALSVSPVLGMLVGGTVVGWGGSMAIFAAQWLLALVLLIWCWRALPETKPATLSVEVTTPGSGWDILRDRQIWYSALLVAGFNIMVFSYFSLAPFMFEQLGLSSQQFGYSGMALALGSLLGALLNRYLLAQGISAKKQILLGSLLAFGAALALGYWQHSLMLLLPCTLITQAFGLAIPNVLSQALNRYRQRLGTAGAVFGLLYYLLIGAGLSLAASGQNLAATLLVCSLLCLGCASCLRASPSPKAAR